MRDAGLDAALRTVAVPLGIVVVAWGAFFILGGRGHLGPVDYPMIQAGVAAIWILAPVVGGLAARPVRADRATRAAVAQAVVITGVLLLLVIASPGICTPRLGDGLGYLVAAAACAATIGGGFGLGFAATRWTALRHGWPLAVTGGATVHLATSAAGSWAFYTLVACP